MPILVHYWLERPHRSMHVRGRDNLPRGPILLLRDFFPAQRHYDDGLLSSSSSSSSSRPREYAVLALCAAQHHLESPARAARGLSFEPSRRNGMGRFAMAMGQIRS